MKSAIILIVASLLVLVGACMNSLTEQPNKESSQGSGNADVLFVKARENPDGSWTFDVTVSHPDTGWDDYADGWDVVLPDSTIIKPDTAAKFTRTLLHPHVNEQPFTRSQTGIVIPDGVKEVRVRAHDIVEGYGGNEVTVNLTTEKGNGYEITKLKS